MPLIEPTPPPLPANPPPSSVVSFAATTMAPELTDASLANAVDITSNTLSIQASETSTENDKTQLISSDIESQKIINNTEVKIEESSVQITDTINEKLSNNSSSDEQPKEEENISNDIQKDNNQSESVVKSESPFNGVDTANDVVIETEQSKQKLTDTVLDDQNQTENLLIKQIDEYNNEVQVNEANVEKNEKSVENDKVVSESKVIDSNVDTIIENVEIEKENLLNKSKISIDHSEIVENKKDDRVIINGDLPAEDDPAETDKSIVTPDESLPPPPSDAMEPLQDDGEAASNGVASTDVASDDVANAEVASTGASDDSFPPPPSELCRSDSDVSPDTLQVNTAGYSCSSRRLVS